jgi:hypothetical protein
MVNVALFGLSANPPSGDGGHVGIVRALVKTGRFDEIWILPVYQHMYSSKRNLLPYEHRVEMCRLAFEPESSSRCAVKVQNTEKDAFLAAMQDKPGVDPATIRVGTIDVIKYIKKQHKERQTGESLALSFVLGSDTFADLMSGKWKDSSGYVHVRMCCLFSSPLMGSHPQFRLWPQHRPGGDARGVCAAGLVRVGGRDRRPQPLGRRRGAVQRLRRAHAQRRVQHGHPGVAPADGAAGVPLAARQRPQFLLPVVPPGARRRRRRWCRQRRGQRQRLLDPAAEAAAENRESARGN